jgi:hypothetical protein
MNGPRDFSNEGFGMRQFFWLLTMIVLGYATRLRAADMTWRNIGPGGGGRIESLACDPRDPQTIYLNCDAGGFYISHDAGRQCDPLT